VGVMRAEGTYLVRFLLPLGWRSLSADGDVESRSVRGNCGGTVGGGRVSESLGDVVGG
jgi:hypothetical protein